MFLDGASSHHGAIARLGFAEGLEEGQSVTSETLLGYVGNTGNAETTPPHLHLGVYPGPHATCAWEAENPCPLLVDRVW